jgi:hypothetical protein
VGGSAYLGLALMWLATASVYAASLGAVAYHAASIVNLGSYSFLARVLPFVAYPMLFVSIYLLHLFLWYLGLLYRGRHEQFPWVLQRHIPTMKLERKFQELRRQKGQSRRPPGNLMKVRG